MPSSFSCPVDSLSDSGESDNCGAYGVGTNNQIEAARVAINRHLKRRGKVWIRMFPFRSFTKKPLEVRMGKGKGAVEGWVAPVLPGRVLFEVSGCSEAVAKEAMSRAANKLCLRCKFLSREG